MRNASLIMKERTASIKGDSEDATCYSQVQASLQLEVGADLVVLARSRELSFTGATEAVTLSPKCISMIYFNTDCYAYIKREALLNGAK